MLVRTLILSVLLSELVVEVRGTGIRAGVPVGTTACHNDGLRSLKTHDLSIRRKRLSNNLVRVRYKAFIIAPFRLRTEQSGKFGSA